MSVRTATRIISAIHNWSLQVKGLNILDFTNTIDTPQKFNGTVCTKQGYILEMYYGIPGYIRHPYGKINIPWSYSGSAEAKKNLFNTMKEELGLVMYKEGIQTDCGYYGPYYIITNLNKKFLLNFTGYHERNSLQIPTNRQCYEAFKKFNKTSDTFTYSNWYTMRD